MSQNVGSGKAEAEEVKWEVRPLSTVNTATYNLALKTSEQTIPLANDFLQKMVTLDAALIGGGFVIAKGDTMPLIAAGLAMMGLLVSLGFAIHGLRPMLIDVDIREFGALDRFNNFRVKVMDKKEYAIRWASRSLFTAFVIGVLGFVAKGIGASQEPKPTHIIIERTSKAIDPFQHIVDNTR